MESLKKKNWPLHLLGIFFLIIRNSKELFMAKSRKFLEDENGIFSILKWECSSCLNWLFPGFQHWRDTDWRNWSIWGVFYLLNEKHSTKDFSCIIAGFVFPDADFLCSYWGDLMIIEQAVVRLRHVFGGQWLENQWPEVLCRLLKCLQLHQYSTFPREEMKVRVWWSRAPHTYGIHCQSVYLHDRALVLLTGLQRYQSRRNPLACVGHCGVQQRQKAYLLAGYITPCNDNVCITTWSGQREGSMCTRNQTNHPGNPTVTQKSLSHYQTSFFPQHH